MKRNILRLALFGVLTLPNISSALTVGGVTWDPNSIFDFGMTATVWETEVNNIGEFVTFYGSVADINGVTNFVTPGAELTYFGSFQLLAVGDYDGDLKQNLIFGNATAEFFYDTTNDFNAADSSTAKSGTSWLTLKGHDFDFWGAVPIPPGAIFSELTAGFDVTHVGDTGSGFGAWDVDVLGGEPASTYLDTNTIAFINGFALNPPGNADFTFSISFQPQVGTDLLRASGEMLGQSKVPEPASLLLLSIGLIGASLANKKYKRYL